MNKKLNPTLFTLFFAFTLLVGCSSEKNTDQELAEDTSVNSQLNTTIRILSYNIHHCNPPGQEDFIDINSIAKTISDQQPDIVALQEVDVDTERSGKGNQAELIAKKLNMNYFFARAIDYGGGEYGVAILSKFPIKERRIHELPTKGNEEDRVLATAKIEIAPNTYILFGNTHLNVPKLSEDRMLQMNEIVNITKKIKDMDVIIAGDFNALPKSDVINHAEENFTNTCEICKPTAPAIKPTKIIDYIFYKANNSSITIEEYEVVNDSYSSDHRPVLAAINFQNLIKTGGN
ncbi:hypothetical protein KCTC52924_03436 [Arenibacter antarcticus]|uniref:Endonuclease/exonuclease/phosphatase family protein n=1 Tax=Arenibacter antarcticus TaxID=2040469 RepID=A0ABW5VG12_9FLAO|nr:endonuclease/exonuclease/phosphatase family protein [Arenibacter sp. H213]MCM4166502.1 endonuclease/exonuclease/phosphatase [Arenibacter sp. H213]